MFALTLLSAILLFVLGLVAAVDLFPQFKTWQSRIGIGRFSSDSVWHERLLATSKRWLKKTPVIKLTDNSRLIIIDIIRGNYKRNAIQYWQQAALLLGLTQVQRRSGRELPEIADFIRAAVPGGQWKQMPSEVDGAILAYAILEASPDPLTVKPAMDDMYRLILSLQGPDGTIAYRKHSGHLRYVDTIGFICPFLTLYGLTYHVPDAVALAIRQIDTFNRFGMLGDSFVPCHTYRTDSGLGVGLYGWGRGLGWYAIGLIDTWNILPEDHPQKAHLQQSVVRFADAALSFQKPNGSWGWLVTSPSSRSDSSATATLAYFLALAGSIAELASGVTSAEKALQYLKSVTRRSGAIDFSQGDTKAIGVHSMEFDILPFTQGFALRTLHLKTP